jgi:hypothetical protein
MTALAGSGTTVNCVMYPLAGAPPNVAVSGTTDQSASPSSSGEKKLPLWYRLPRGSRRQ